MKLNKKSKLKINHKSSSAESGMESQTVKEDIEEKESGMPVEQSAAVNLKPSDFVIAKFTNNKKRKPYHYVDTTLKFLFAEEFEVKCLKSGEFGQNMYLLHRK